MLTLKLKIRISIIALIPLFNSFAEARGSGVVSSGPAHVNSYVRASGTYVNSYNRRLPTFHSTQSRSTTGLGAAAESTPVQGSLMITEGTAPEAAEVEHIQTEAEWQAECKREGSLAGTGWGFCVLDTTGMLASNP